MGEDAKVIQSTVIRCHQPLKRVPKCALEWNDDGTFDIVCENSEDADRAYGALLKKPDLSVRIRDVREEEVRPIVDALQILLDDGTVQVRCPGACATCHLGDLVRSQDKAQELAVEAGLPYAELREDGAVVFGDGCLVLKPTENGKLGLTIQPTKCGEVQGKVLLDYLVKTAGKGVVIEIPPAEEEAKE